MESEEKTDFYSFMLKEKEMLKLEQDQIELINFFIKRYLPVDSSGLTKYGKEKFRKLIQDNGFEEVYDSLKISFEYYYDNEKDSCNNCLANVGKIINIRKATKRNPIIKKRYYVRKAIKNKYENTHSEEFLWKLLNDYLKDEIDFAHFMSCFNQSENWDEFQENIKELLFGRE